MPITEAAVQPILAKLGSARKITHRKMFGGIGIYCDGTFFAVIDDDHLYFKVDDINRSAYESLDMPQWIIKGQGPMPYYEVPLKVLEEPETLGQWIDDAVEVAKRKKK